MRARTYACVRVRVRMRVRVHVRVRVQVSVCVHACNELGESAVVQERLQALRREAEEAEIAECTFHPIINAPPKQQLLVGPQVPLPSATCQPHGCASPPFCTASSQL